MKVARKAFWFGFFLVLFWATNRLISINVGDQLRIPAVERSHFAFFFFLKFLSLCVLLASRLELVHRRSKQQLRRDCTDTIGWLLQNNRSQLGNLTSFFFPQSHTLPSISGPINNHAKLTIQLSTPLCGNKVLASLEPLHARTRDLVLGLSRVALLQDLGDGVFELLLLRVAGGGDGAGDDAVDLDVRGRAGGRMRAPADLAGEYGA
ncbi:hypothetical protein KC357_g157 [Hortaea werneckii]|nr:hypothetical protein KC357_g157 [Hortaea werneckii]